MIAAQAQEEEKETTERGSSIAKTQGVRMTNYCNFLNFALDLLLLQICSDNVHPPNLVAVCPYGKPYVAKPRTCNQKRDSLPIAEAAETMTKQRGPAQTMEDFYSIACGRNGYLFCQISNYETVASRIAI
jgi:hypothetical protein